MSERLPGMDSVTSRDPTAAIQAIGDGSRSIGEVLNLLTAEFPELTVSKIRFLEGQGLVQPARSGSGYRMFTREDIERIQYILREQRDHFLPLKVIKSRLTSWDRGEEPAAPAEALRPPETYFAPGGAPLDAETLAKATGLTIRQIEGEYVDPAELRGHRPETYDSILLLASSLAGSESESDARTLLGFLVLEEIFGSSVRRPHVVLELMDPTNAELFRDREIELVIGPSLISYMLCQEFLLYSWK